MTLKTLTLGASILSLAVALPSCSTRRARACAPADLLKPLAESWPTYSGDYTGQALQLADADQPRDGEEPHAGVGRRAERGAGDGRRPAAAAAGRVIVGGEGTGDFAVTRRNRSRARRSSSTARSTSPMPDNAWALDARDGRELWHYYWKTRGGTHIANRGLGMWNDYLYMETPDNYLVSLEAKTGKERWHKVIADFNQQYFSTTAPIVVGNHVIVGTGNDLDSPGFLQSFDRGDRRAAVEVLHRADEPRRSRARDVAEPRRGAPRRRACRGCRGVYDPGDEALHLRHRQSDPGLHAPGAARATTSSPCSLVAVNVDTGKMAWYFQTSPHDMHDWDSAQTPILIDGVINGRKRKLVSTAARNGYFFTLDRVTGEHMVTSKYGLGDQLGRRASTRTASLRRNPDKDPTVGGALVSPTAGGTINWEPPAYSPDTGLFYVSERNGYSIFYLTDLDPRGSMGLGGKEEVERRVGRQLPDRDRLQDRQDRLAAPLSGWRAGRRRRAADHGRQARVRRRRRRQHRGPRRR